jgi:hypothetical protein
MVMHEEIARKAYELWEQSGRIPGHDLDNWIEAERIMKARSEEEKSSGQKDSNKCGPGRSGGGKNKSGGLRRKRG